MTADPYRAAEASLASAVPFVRPDLPTAADVLARMEAIIASSQLTKGRELALFEAAVREHVGATHAVAVSSCTTGLMLVLRSTATAHDRSVGPCGSSTCIRANGIDRTNAATGVPEVIVPSFTFLAAPAAIAWAGLRPVFVDVDPDTFTVCPAAVEAAITNRTAAILGCHTFGCPCDTDRLGEIAIRHGIPLLVDAAHGFGTSLRGRPVGAEGTAQVFSLSPTKLVVAGEGGVVTTSCDCLAALVREGREYGNDGRYDCHTPGINARMPEFCAALGRLSLERLDETLAARQQAAATYRQALSGIAGIGFQAIPSHASSSWKDYSITIDSDVIGCDRDSVRASLASRGIDTRTYYSPPCHRMPAFAGLVPPKTSLNVTDRLSSRILSLPMGGHVTPAVAARVALAIREALAVPEPVVA